MPIIREKRQSQIGPIGVARASRAGVITGRAIEKSANQFSDIFLRRAQESAQKKGEEAGLAAEREAIITINPETGKPEAFEPPSFAGSIYTDAYQRVIDRRFQQSIDEEMRLKASELAVRYEDNPNGANLYSESMSDYIASMANYSEGSFKSYIQDMGTNYLNSTRLNLANNQIRRERAASARAQAAAVEDGYQNLEFLIATSGPAALGEGSVGSTVSASVDQAVTDGEEAGLFDPSAVANMNGRKQLAVVAGLARNAAANTQDPETLAQIKASIGSQGAVPMPAGYETLAQSLQAVGSNYSVLKDIERVSDGVFDDVISNARAVQAAEIAEMQSQTAIRVATIGEGLGPTLANARSLAMSPLRMPASVAENAAAEYASSTRLIEQAIFSGNEDLAKAYTEVRSTALSGTVEGLQLRMVDGLSSKDTNQLEAAIKDRDVGLAPASTRDSFSALLRLDSQGLDPNILKDMLTFVGSYADGAGKYQATVNANVASETASVFEPMIASLNRTPPNRIDTVAESLVRSIGAIDNLDEGEREGYESAIYKQVYRSKISNFFSTLPSPDAIAEARSVLDGGAYNQQLLSDSQVESLSAAGRYSDEAGDKSGMISQFNRGVTTANARNAQIKEEQENADRLFQLSAGQLSAGSAKDQTLMDEVLGEINWNDASEDFSGSLRFIAQAQVPPESLVSNWKNLAAGNIRTQNAAMQLSHYANLRDYNAEGVMIRSPILDSLTEAEVAELDYMLDLTSVVGSGPETIAEIVAVRQEVRNDPRFKESFEGFLGESDETPVSVDMFLRELDGFDQLPASGVRAMRGAASMLFATSRYTNTSLSEFTSRMQKQIDRSYPDGNGVVIGVNGSNRTPFPISVAAPNAETEFKQFVLDKAMQVDNTIESAVLGPLVSRDGALPLEAYPQGTASIVLVPLSGSARGQEINYSVYRLTVDGREPIFEAVDGIPYPLIVSNKDPEFTNPVQKKAVRDNQASISSARTAFSVPTSIPFERVGASAVSPDTIGLGGMGGPQELLQTPLELN